MHWRSFPLLLRVLVLWGLGSMLPVALYLGGIFLIMFLVLPRSMDFAWAKWGAADGERVILAAETMRGGLHGLSHELRHYDKEGAEILPRMALAPWDAAARAFGKAFFFSETQVQIFDGKELLTLPFSPPGPEIRAVPRRDGLLLLAGGPEGLSLGLFDETAGLDPGRIEWKPIASDRPERAFSSRHALFATGDSLWIATGVEEEVYIREWRDTGRLDFRNQETGIFLAGRLLGVTQAEGAAFIRIQRTCDGGCTQLAVPFRGRRLEPEREIPNKCGREIYFANGTNLAAARLANGRLAVAPDILANPFPEEGRDIRAALRGEAGRVIIPLFSFIALFLLIWPLWGFLFARLVSRTLDGEKPQTFRIASGEVRRAPFLRRAGAVILDGLVVATPIILLIALFIAFLFRVLPDERNAPPPPVFFVAFPLFMLFLVFFALIVPLAYTSISESRWGRTLGKRWMGIRVVTEEGRPPSLGVAFLRNLVKMFGDGSFYYVCTVITVTLTDRWQSLGDLAAGTFVIEGEKSVSCRSEERDLSSSR